MNIEIQHFLFLPSADQFDDTNQLLFDVIMLEDFTVVFRCPNQMVLHRFR